MVMAEAIFEMNDEKREPDTALGLLFTPPVVTLASRLAMVTQKKVLAEYSIKMMEWRVIYHLVQNHDLHLRELARQVSTDASHASRVVANLEERGLVERFDDEDDARRTRFSVTEAGRKLFDVIWPQANAISEEFNSLFTVAERRRFEAMLRKATSHANQLLGWHDPD
jgi:Transcriptional regulators